MQRIEAERARRRQEAGKKIDLKTNLSKGSTDEHVAAELGMSMTQWKKLRTIFERAQQGDAEASELMKALDAGDISVHRAYQTVKGQLDSEKGEKSRITKALEEAKKNLDEALQNPLTIEVENRVCHLITNPIPGRLLRNEASYFGSRKIGSDNPKMDAPQTTLEALRTLIFPQEDD